MFAELGAEESESVPFHLLYQHPIIQDCMHMCQRFKTVVSTLFCSSWIFALQIERNFRLQEDYELGAME